MYTTILGLYNENSDQCYGHCEVFHMQPLGTLVTRLYIYSYSWNPRASFDDVIRTSCQTKKVHVAWEPSQMFVQMVQRLQNCYTQIKHSKVEGQMHHHCWGRLRLEVPRRNWPRVKWPIPHLCLHPFAPSSREPIHKLLFGR